MDLFAPKIQKDSPRKDLLKRRLHTELALGEDAAVMVTELACADAGCPEIETIIAVLQGGQSRLQVTWPGTVADLSDDDLDAICREFLSRSRLAAPCTEGCCDV